MYRLYLLTWCLFRQAEVGAQGRGLITGELRRNQGEKVKCIYFNRAKMTETQPSRTNSATEQKVDFSKVTRAAKILMYIFKRGPLLNVWQSLVTILRSVISLGIGDSGSIRHLWAKVQQILRSYSANLRIVNLSIALYCVFHSDNIRNYSGVTMGESRGTAPGDTLQGLTPDLKYFCG